MLQTKLRIIRPQQPERGYKPIFGITIPDNVAMFFKNTYFSISKTNEGIMLISGTSFKNQKNEIDLEKYRV